LRCGVADWRSWVKALLAEEADGSERMAGTARLVRV
jgi:hypothetical protein